MDFDVHGRLDFAEPEVIRAEQTRLLNEHLAYCRAKSPYYSRVLRDRPDRPITIESLAELPLTGKADLAEFNDSFVALPPEEIADISFTSGTTGRPCRISYSASDLRRLGYNDAKQWTEDEDDKELLEDDRWYREKRDLKYASKCIVGPILLDEDDEEDEEEDDD